MSKIQNFPVNILDESAITEAKENLFNLFDFHIIHLKERYEEDLKNFMKDNERATTRHGDLMKTRDEVIKNAVTEIMPKFTIEESNKLVHVLNDGVRMPSVVFPLRPSPIAYFSMNFEEVSED